MTQRSAALPASCGCAHSPEVVRCSARAAALAPTLRALRESFHPRRQRLLASQRRPCGTRSIMFCLYLFLFAVSAGYGMGTAQTTTRTQCDYVRDGEGGGMYIPRRHAALFCCCMRSLSVNNFPGIPPAPKPEQDEPPSRATDCTRF